MLKKSSVAILSYIFSLEKPCFLNFLKAFNFSDMCAQKCNLTNMQILSFKEISLRHRPNGIKIWPRRANKGKQKLKSADIYLFSMQRNEVNIAAWLISSSGQSVNLNNVLCFLSQWALLKRSIVKHVTLIHRVLLRRVSHGQTETM